jgi:hypothetical protein
MANMTLVGTMQEVKPYVVKFLNDRETIGMYVELESPLSGDRNGRAAASTASSSGATQD